MATVSSAPGRGAHAHRGWSIAWGVLLIVVGILALLMPEIAAMATVLTFAWLMIFAGAVELIHSFQTRHGAGFGWELVAGVITLALGLLVLFFPIAGIATLALWIGILIFAGGIVRLIFAFRVRPAKGWVWVLVDGILSIVIGGLIAWGWPGSSIAFIGLLTGFWLLFSGFWRIMLDGRASSLGGAGMPSPAR